ncbi:hypothetical protein MMC21_002512 [Puttea exsequens]|nr:hypothetical protein [Puttea exsequens]
MTEPTEEEKEVQRRSQRNKRQRSDFRQCDSSSDESGDDDSIPHRKRQFQGTGQLTPKEERINTLVPARYPAQTGSVFIELPLKSRHDAVVDKNRPHHVTEQGPQGTGQGRSQLMSSSFTQAPDYENSISPYPNQINSPINPQPQSTGSQTSKSSSPREPSSGPSQRSTSQASENPSRALSAVDPPASVTQAHQQTATSSVPTTTIALPSLPQSPSRECETPKSNGGDVRNIPGPKTGASSVPPSPPPPQFGQSQREPEVPSTNGLRAEQQDPRTGIPVPARAQLRSPDLVLKVRMKDQGGFSIMRLAAWPYRDLLFDLLHQFWRINPDNLEGLQVDYTWLPFNHLGKVVYFEADYDFLSLRQRIWYDMRRYPTADHTYIVLLVLFPKIVLRPPNEQTPADTANSRAPWYLRLYDWSQFLQ